VYPKSLDNEVKAFVEHEFSQVLAATEYPNYDISVTVENFSFNSSSAVASANGDIKIKPAVVANAMKSKAALWSLRITIAHELGHVMAGHRFTTATRQQKHELEADRRGMEYFKRLGWSCKVWVDGRRRAADQGNVDAEHDRSAMYEQARQLCDE
jgi:hypothetical protein